MAPAGRNFYAAVFVVCSGAVNDPRPDDFPRVLAQYRDRVYALVLRLVGDPAEAEDLTQEAFLKAFRALGSYDPSRPMLSWLFKIAHNHCLDHLRARGERLETLDDPEAPLDPADASAGVEEALEAADRAEAVRRLVDSLPSLYREVLLLRHQEDLDYAAIAEVTGLPLGTVKIRLFRARELLKTKLEAAGLGA